MKIAVTYNLENEKYDFVSADYDTPETIENIKKALESRGHKVFLVEADENAYDKFKKLKNQIDLVFNYSLGIYGPCRQAHIPAALEMLKIPYTGCDAAAIALCQNKAHTKEILINYGVKTANFQVVSPTDNLDNYNIFKIILEKLRYPIIVKCLHEDSSIGLEGNCVVFDEKSLKERILYVHKNFNQPALIEEYLNGREFTVGALGNLPTLQFLPPLEIVPSPKIKKGPWIWNKGPKFIGEDIKQIKKLAGQYNLFYVCPIPNLSDELENKMKLVLEKVYKIIPARDFIRVDFRVVNKEPYLLEVNNCCHLAKNGTLIYEAEAAGLNYNQLINKITDSAIKRYALS